MATPDTKQFYNSKEWQDCREVALVRDHYLCQHCLREKRFTPATSVHHIEHLKDCPERALDLDNLISLCTICHNKEHPEKLRKFGRKKEKVISRRVRAIETIANEEIT